MPAHESINFDFVPGAMGIDSKGFNISYNLLDQLAKQFR